MKVYLHTQFSMGKFGTLSSLPDLFNGLSSQHNALGGERRKDGNVYFMTHPSHDVDVD